MKKLVCLIALIALVLPASAVIPIVNGSFEDGQSPWTFHQASLTLGGTDGMQAAWIDPINGSPVPAYIEQTFTTARRLTTVSWDQRAVSGPAPVQLWYYDHSAPSPAWLLLTQQSSVNYQWRHYAWDVWTEVRQQPLTLRWQAYDNYGDGTFIDNIVATPEPTSFSLIAGIGLIGFCAWRRLR